MADFDPDAYLRDKSAEPGGGFDPDAYLAAKQQPAPKPSLLQRLGQGLSDAGRTVAAGAHGVYDAARHPIDTLTDPSKRRELERGVDDMVTLGAGQKVAGWLGRKLGDSPDVDLQATQGQDAASAPGYRAGGNLVGAVIPGAASLAGKGGAALAERALGGVAAHGAMSGAAMGAARGVLGYEAGAVPAAAAQAAIAGQSPLDAAREAATNPLGLALAGGGGAIGGAGRGAAAKIRDPKHLTGRVLQDVEAGGGRVRMFGKPVEGGVFEAPELTDLKEGRAGVNELAQRSVGRIVQAHGDRLAQAREAFGEAADQIIAEQGDRHVPTLNTHQALDAVDAENTVNGIVGNDRVASATAKLRQMLTTDTGQLDAQASAAAGKPITVQAPAVKAGDLIKTRKLVNRMWRQTQDPSEKHVFGQALNGLAEDAAAVDPRIGQMNATFKQEMQQLSQANDALFGRAKPDIRDTEGARAAAAGRLGRLGDDTQAGTLGEDRMRHASEASPDVAREALLNRSKKAQERLRYGGAGETSTSIESGMGRAVERGAHKIGGAVLGHAVGGPLGGFLGAEAAGAVNNPLALKLRLGLPAAEAAGRAAGARSGVAVNRLTEVARQRREADAAAAARLMGQ
jgi:hypothetical protein